jgi:DNA phosphorothioation-dependent restriction protein DptG
MQKAYIKTAIPCENCGKKIMEAIQSVKGIGSVAIDMQNSEIALTPVAEFAETLAFNQIINEVQNRLVLINKVVQGVRFGQ